MGKRFYMPPEWAEHEATLVEWPVKDSLCWKDNSEEVCFGYGEVITAIAEFEPVLVLVNEETKEEAFRIVEEMKQADKKYEDICYKIIPHNDAWIRDNGPTIVINGIGERKGISWQFNAWGEKYTPYDLDNQASGRILKQLHIPEDEVALVLEGGSIHVDGEKTLITTKECLLNPNRNPNMEQEAIATIIKKKLDIEQIIWLNKGLFGDETDGHVDNVCCFVRPGVVMIQACKDPEDPNYGITQENLAILNNYRDAKGRKLKILVMPHPPSATYGGEPLTLSYMNYYMVNGGIILPVFGGRSEETYRQAYEVLESVFPNRIIRKIDGMRLIKEGGNVHCITQQIPKATKPDEEDIEGKTR